MQASPVLPGALGRWHEMGDDVLHVHLEVANNSYHPSLVIVVTTITQDVSLMQHYSWSYEDVWRPGA